MKDNLQNIADLIGALAEDIEEIKKKLDAKDSPDRDEALKRLAVKLEPVISFFNGNTPENISGIFGSKEAIEKYKKSLVGEIAVGLLIYAEANDDDMRERGVPPVKDLLNKILEMLTAHVEKDKLIPEKVQQKQGFISGLWQAIRPDKAINTVKRLWGKIPDGWYKNPYAWAGIGCTLVFLALFATSWMQWHEYREENRQLKTVADKYNVTTVMLNELYPELAVTVGAYEKLVETVGADSTLTIFKEQVKAVKKESQNRSK